MRKGRLKNKIAFIAGGATGIGAETCRLFAREELAGLIIADINEEEGILLMKELREMGIITEFLYCDASSEENWIAAVEKAVLQFRTIDILVNAFGIGGPLVRPILTETSLDAWEKVFKINSTGVFLGMKHIIPIMKKRGKGSICQCVLCIRSGGNHENDLLFCFKRSVSSSFPNCSNTICTMQYSCKCYISRFYRYAYDKRYPLRSDNKKREIKLNPS